MKEINASKNFGLESRKMSTYNFITYCTVISCDSMDVMREHTYCAHLTGLGVIIITAEVKYLICSALLPHFFSSHSRFWNLVSRLRPTFGKYRDIHVSLITIFIR